MTTENTQSAPGAGATATYAERRAAMADETRTRILEACVAILGRGVTELSIPAVAREAGVSVPTVYRNFADKKTLVQETALHLRRLRGPISVPSTYDDVPAHLERTFAQAASFNESLRVALWSGPILAERHGGGEVEQRLAEIDRIFGPALECMSPADREHARLFACVMCSSATLRAFREVTNSSPEQTAQTVAWALERLLGRPWRVPATASKTKRRGGAKKGSRK